MPQWFKSELAKKKKSDPATPNLKRDRDTDKDPIHPKSQVVINNDVDAACKLNKDKGEIYRFVFHKNNLNGVSFPKVGGCKICLKFHIEGCCKSTCSRASSHIKLEYASLINLRKLCSKVCDNYIAFKTKRKWSIDTNKNKGENPDRNTTD